MMFYSSDKADWFLKADDDTYVVVENLRLLTKDYNASDPTYMGLKFTHHEYTKHKEGYMSGGAGKSNLKFCFVERIFLYNIYRIIF